MNRDPKKINIFNIYSVSLNRIKTSGGYYRIYAFLIIVVCVFGYFAYFLFRIPTLTPLKIQDEYQKFYKKNEDGVNIYGGVDILYNDISSNNRAINNTRNNPYPDSLESFANSDFREPGSLGLSDSSNKIRVNTSSDTQANISQRDSIGVISNFSPEITSNEYIDTSQITSPNSSLGNSPVNLLINQNRDSSEDSMAYIETIRFQSKIQENISFLVPKNSKVTESGNSRNLQFNIEILGVSNIGEMRSSQFNMMIKKDSQSCQDPVYSFAIDLSEGVDYRIIHNQKQLALKNTYRYMQSHEEFGTYIGQIGIRTNACIFTAVPTKVEIRSYNFDRKEILSGFIVMDTILSTLDL